MIRPDRPTDLPDSHFANGIRYPSGSQYEERTSRERGRQSEGLNMCCRTGIVCGVFIALFVAPNLCAADVEIPDTNLKNVILDILHSKQIKDDKITVERLETIFSLHANGKQIANLAGLEHCRNLSEVRLAGNRITSVAPLAACVRIQSLDLTHNQLSDITPLAKLTKLQYLKLDDNNVKSLEPVQGLKALACLYFDRNQVSSLKPLAGLPKLHALYAAENRLTDIVPLQDIKWLTSLDVSSNKITDIRPLTKLTELKLTFLQENQIRDIGPFVEMAKKDASGAQRFAPFWRLFLGKNPLAEPSTARHLEQLKTIGVRVDMDYLRKNKRKTNTD